MKVCLLQTNIQWQNTQENLRQAQMLMDTQPDADLYVLPEMWNTGFATSPGEQEHIGSQTALAWMER
ncbi:MAG: nitrilase family protein, partial [Bacteroidaceae bacterium]|nr:nitrilase family protein [Bacteroidaceae bacterium]